MNLGIFSSPTHAVSEAMDKINNRWGEFVITPVLMMGMGDIILDRISFGGVKELEEIYFEYSLHLLLGQHEANIPFPLVEALPTDQEGSRFCPGVLPAIGTGKLRLA